MGLLILMSVFAVCVIIGIPVAFALGIAAVSAFFYEGLPLIVAFQRISVQLTLRIAILAHFLKQAPCPVFPSKSQVAQ